LVNQTVTGSLSGSSSEQQLTSRARIAIWQGTATDRNGYKRR